MMVVNRLTTAVIGGAALVAGVLTVRRLRRGRAGRSAPATTAEAAGIEARAATDAGREAIDHAGTAARHGLEAARSSQGVDGTDTYRARGGRQLRRVGKGWARR